MTVKGINTGNNKNKLTSKILKNKSRDLVIALWVIIIGRSLYGITAYFFLNGKPEIILNILITNILLGAALYISYKGYYRLTNLMAGSVFSLSILMTAHYDGGNIIHLFILVLPVIMISIQLEMVYILFYSGFTILSIIVYTAFSGAIEFSQSYMPIAFILTVTGLLYLNVKYRQNVEKERIEAVFQISDATIYALAYAAEVRDRTTGSHLDRTAQYMRILAESLMTNDEYHDYITADYILDLEKAAVLHDIGKVGVSDSILLKPGKLTADEFDEMKKHCEYGVDIIRKAQEKIFYKSIFDIALEIIRSHHEKWDGTGYPSGISGNAIPLSARLMSLTDVWDALRNDRPYKEAFSAENSKSIIEDGRGTQFDPLIVDAFIENYDRFKKISTVLAG